MKRSEREGKRREEQLRRYRSIPKTKEGE